jgi:hypothetical protein
MHLEAGSAGSLVEVVQRAGAKMKKQEFDGSERGSMRIRS